MHFLSKLHVYTCEYKSYSEMHIVNDSLNMYVWVSPKKTRRLKANGVQRQSGCHRYKIFIYGELCLKLSSSCQISPKKLH